MDRINYAGDTLLTGTAIAHALLHYAQALAQVGSSGTVEIPTLDAEGRRGSSALLVGPASQLVSSTIATDRDEIEDPELVGRLESMTAELRMRGMPTARPRVDDSPPHGYLSDYGI